MQCETNSWLSNAIALFLRIKGYKFVQKWTKKLKCLKCFDSKGFLEKRATHSKNEIILAFPLLYFQLTATAYKEAGVSFASHESPTRMNNNNNYYPIQHSNNKWQQQSNRGELINYTLPSQKQKKKQFAGTSALHLYIQLLHIYYNK